MKLLKGRKFAIGTIRSRKMGQFIKLDSQEWGRVKPPQFLKPVEEHEQAHPQDKMTPWQKDLDDLSKKVKLQAALDEYVSRKFEEAGKPIRAVLFTARDLLGEESSAASQHPQGVKQLAKAVIEQAYEHGPSGFTAQQCERLHQGLNSMMNGIQFKGMPLLKALVVGPEMFPEFKNDPKWFHYCACRVATMNEGLVDLGKLGEYMKKAKAFHGGKVPPMEKVDPNKVGNHEAKGREI